MAFGAAPLSGTGEARDEAFRTGTSFSWPLVMNSSFSLCGPADHLGFGATEVFFADDGGAIARLLPRETGAISSAFSRLSVSSETGVALVLVIASASFKSPRTASVAANSSATLLDASVGSSTESIVVPQATDSSSLCSWAMSVVKLPENESTIVTDTEALSLSEHASLESGGRVRPMEGVEHTTAEAYLALGA